MLLTTPVPATSAAPMYWRRTFPGDPVQAKAARAFAAQLLHGCPMLDDILLVLDELAVNAVRHTRSGEDGGCFTVELSQDPRQVIVGVADQGGTSVPRLRRPCVPGDLARLEECGRGLLTVDALAARWSWTGGEQGRTVRAVFGNPPG
ncbi:ATP-binding protein [Actinomadura logoneensis]|uniref:ATP-binding protein n=1 Tax=Actinomadura logoneensis TaxID=2293572 RepID=A0A372JQ16_9ACTN|nr:ATP-binding protein [Actinomadura logoneensis]RFU41854.1 ATP-binding protein [Actinomadura logoneensis]